MQLGGYGGREDLGVVVEGCMKKINIKQKFLLVIL